MNAPTDAAHLRPAEAPGPRAPALARPDVALADALWADQGTVLLSGTQALIRLARMQRQRDAAAGLDTQGFISGYRGSPLGGVDAAAWKAGERLRDAGVHFSPAINEELAATQVLGTQRVEGDPQRTVEAVFALWYGKGPGVDRAGDALHHGHAYGSSPHGGVLVVAGDDHGCVSSSMPHQSDGQFQAWGLPVLQPADVGELIEFGLYGWALSRYSGAWVAMAALSEVVESTATVDLDAIQARAATWADAAGVQAATGHQPPPDGLHVRWPDLPSLRLESRKADKLQAVAAFAQVNRIDRLLIAAPRARVGILTCGKAHHDLMEVFRRLRISPAQLEAAGVRLLKLGLAFPVEATGVRAFARGLDEILVVEEKAGLVEAQLRQLFYNAPAAERPALIGKTDRDGSPLISALGELRPSRLIVPVSAWLQRHFPGSAVLGEHAAQVRDFTAPDLLSNAADAVRRLPAFCAGCPHNTSTRVPAGSQAKAGIGCHFMASWMDRDTAGLIQMGGEGVDWVSHSRFTRVPHVFQNLGDGTYWHSGYLAIRQAVAARATMTYKILYNDAVAMTGGQPVDGLVSVDAIARQLESEGIRGIAIVSDDITRHTAHQTRYPAGTSFHDRAELDAVQRRLREQPGVTALIYEQTCAAEQRRRRKKGELAPMAERLLIHTPVCEGCGDCGAQSNCVALQPDETPLGRKRRIDQSACNGDRRCADGFCPSFVAVRGGVPRRQPGLAGAGRAQLLARAAALPPPQLPHLQSPGQAWEAPWDLLITGVGGTGVVTVGALVAMAAHLQGHRASVLDFMGFAQKGGAVLSYVRLADVPERLHQARIDTQQADALLACDLVVGASPEALQTVRHGRTRILANTHPIPLADLQRQPDADLQVDSLLAKLRHAAGDAQLETFDAQALAEALLGDTQGANIVALGYAWQRGVVPVALHALQRATELNGVAVAMNHAALAIGRLAAADPAALQALQPRAAAPTPLPGLPAGDDSTDAHEPLPALLARARAHLSAWQDGRWADRFSATVARVQAAEARWPALPATGTNADASGDADTRSPDRLPFTRTVARSLLKLMSYKDEYEVARLYSDGSLQQALARQFEPAGAGQGGALQLDIWMAPPLLSRPRDGRPPRKRRLSGRWLLPLLKLLAHGKHLRGTRFDPFGHSDERRTERQLISQFEARVDELIGLLDAAAAAHRDLPAVRALALQVAALPLGVRGYGHVKLANLALARAREAELMHRLAPQRHPRPPAHGAPSGQIRGIAVVSG